MRSILRSSRPALLVPVLAVSLSACSRMQLAEKIPVLGTATAPAKPAASDCPNFHGIFMDSGAGEETTIRVLMTLNEGKTEISTQDEILAIDGKSHLMESKRGAQYSASCDAGQLKIVTGPSDEKDTTATKSETVISKLNDDGDLRFVSVEKDATTIKNLKRVMPFPTLAPHVTGECPIITGQFENLAAGSQDKLEMQSGVTDAAVIYEINAQSFKADGKIHLSKDGKEKYVANCTKGKLTVLGDKLNVTIQKTATDAIQVTSLTNKGVRTTTLSQKPAINAAESACAAPATQPPVGVAPVETPVAPEASAATGPSETAVSDARAVVDGRSKSDAPVTTTAAPATAEPVAVPAAPAPAPAPAAKEPSQPTAAPAPTEEPYQPADETDFRRS